MSDDTTIDDTICQWLAHQPDRAENQQAIQSSTWIRRNEPEALRSLPHRAHQSLITGCLFRLERSGRLTRGEDKWTWMLAEPDTMTPERLEAARDQLLDDIDDGVHAVDVQDHDAADVLVERGDVLVDEDPMGGLAAPRYRLTDPTADDYAESARRYASKNTIAGPESAQDSCQGGSDGAGDVGT